MNKKVLLVSLIVFIIAVSVGGYFWFQSNLTKTNQAETTDVKNVVENFGKVLKNVSLSTPKEIIAQSMKENYEAFIYPTLLSEWINDPSKAPGRLTSSPWPDRIDVTAINKISSIFYEASGNVVEMTSQEVVNGGNVGQYPVMVKVEKINNKWLITSFEGYPKTQSADSSESKRVVSVKGYFFRKNTTDLEEVPVTCDALVVTGMTGGDKSLIDEFIQWVKDENTVNALDEKTGNLILNLYLGDLSPTERQKIVSSVPQNTVELEVIDTRSEGRGVSACYSFVKILKVD